jgi:hypothetical protein
VILQGMVDMGITEITDQFVVRTERSAMGGGEAILGLPETRN